MGNLELENMGQVPDCVITRLKTSQNVPQERKPENVGFLKNQFPVQFSGGWGRTCIVSSSVAENAEHTVVTKETTDPNTLRLL